MQITEKNLRDNLITEFNYHDAEIIKVTNNKKDVTILLKDGFNEDQINELTFVNCEITHQYDLENRTIYQLDDLVHFERSGWDMSFLVWMKDNDLIEKISIECDNIICKKYENLNILQDSEEYFEEKMKEVENQIGELTVKKLQDKKVQQLLDNIFHENERQVALSDLSQYTLVNEEDLNEETVGMREDEY